LAIEPLNCTCCHISSPKRISAARARIARFNSTSTMTLENSPRAHSTRHSG
jgi:hypothetical protein